MTATLTLFGLVELLIGIAVLVLAFLAWNHREHPSGVPLVVMSVGTAGWAFTSGVQVYIPDPTLTAIFGMSLHVFAAVTALGWFYVAVQYTDTKRLRSQRLLVMLIGALVVEIALVATDPIHGLFAGSESTVTDNGVFIFSMGPLYAYHAVFAFGLAFAGWGMFGRSFMNARGVYRRQSGVILVAATVAIGLIAVSVATRAIPGLSLSVVGMGFATIGLFWAIFVADFFETAPVARETLIESMNEAVIGLDTSNHVVAINPQAKDLLGVDAEATGAPAEDVLEPVPELLAWVRSPKDADSEFRLDINGETRHYEVSSSLVVSEPTLGDGQITLGRTLIIRDVSQRVRRHQQLEAQTERLREQKALLERQNKRLDWFADALSTTLLEAVREAETSFERACNTESDRHFDDVEAAHDRVRTRIDDILTMARAETSPNDLEEINLETVVTQAWEAVTTAGAALNIATPPETTIEADASLLQAHFENLFRHVITDRAKVDTVTVGKLAEQDEREGFYTEVDSRDFGVDTGESNHAVAGGRDVSLTVAEELADIHGWSFETRATDEESCRFEVTTP